MNKLIIFITSLLVCLVITPVTVQASTLVLTPKQLTLNVNQQDTLTVTLHPQGNRVIGVDLFLTFDPNIIEVVSVTNRDAIPINPALRIDNQKGTVKTAYIHNYGNFTNATKPLADITLKGKKAGNTTLKISLSPGNTRDTNVAVAGGVDTLTQGDSAFITVFNAAINPQSQSTSVSPTPTSPPVLSVTQNPSQTPQEATVLPELEAFTPTASISPTLVPNYPISEAKPVPPQAIPPKVLGTTTNSLSFPWALVLVLSFAGVIVFVLLKTYPQPRPSPTINFAS